MSRGRTTYLSDFSQGPSLLSEIDDNAAATILCLLDSFLDTKDQVWPASANIGSEHVATIALCNEVSLGVRKRKMVVIPRRGFVEIVELIHRTSLLDLQNSTQ
jgi:hypothetical protein